MKDKRDMRASGRLPIRRRRIHSPAERAPADQSPRLTPLLTQIETYQLQLFEQNRQLVEARSQLKESYARYAELFDLAPVGYVSLDRQGRIRELNQKAARLLGFSRTWLVDKPFIVFVAKHHVQRFLTYLTRSVQNNSRKTIEADLFVDGGHLPVQITMHIAIDDANLNYRMTIVDLRDVRRTERELQESLENWHSLVHNAPDVIMTVDHTGKIIFVNRGIWGRSSRALVGTDIFDYIAADQRENLQHCLDAVFQTGTRRSCDIVRADGGKEFWYGFCFGPTESEHDGLDAGKKAATLIVREISEEKRAEHSLRKSSEQLREFSARLEAVREDERTRVAREIHDELGQALTVLKLDLSWLASKKRSSEKNSKEKMSSIIGQVDEMIQRVRRIASELRPSILDDLGLIAAIEWQLADFQKRTGIKCKLRSTVPSIELDRERSTAIFRVVQEALTNVVRHAEASHVRVDLETDGDVLKLIIADNGKGMRNSIASDTQSLGFIGMKERLSRFGGGFEIGSQPGKGTRLEVSLSLLRGSSKKHD